jgi:hypothetical protein
MRNYTNELINEMSTGHLIVGDIVQHPDGREVEIVGGGFMGTHGVSNQFTWREVMSNGNLSDLEENGYGWFNKIKLN